MKLADRFWAKVRKTDGCWEWTAARRNGYGVIGSGGKYGRVLYAHRLSWELHHGPIPMSMWILHRCDNRGCVRPDHLFVGTHLDNLADMRAKGRGFIPTATRGADHPWYGRDSRGALNPHAKLTEAQVAHIRSTTGIRNGAELARRFGVSPSAISSVRRGRRWHI